MTEYIVPLEKLIEQFRLLPGVGEKTATRYALSLLHRSEEEVNRFADAVIGAKRDVHECRVCHNISESDLCPICADPERTSETLCVVETPQDAMAMERLGGMGWKYHILGGVLNPKKQITADKLHIADIMDRIGGEGVSEIVLATNCTFEGDTTASYLGKLIAARYPEVRVTRPAQGIPVGGSLEYADPVTLTQAIRGRKTM